MARPVTYGQAFGGRSIVQIPVDASISFRHEGGRWVTLAATRYARIASNNVNDLVGWAETTGTWSSSATAGADVIAVNVAYDAVYEMPIVSATTESTCKGLIGKQSDLEQLSDIQYVNADASAIGNILIVGYKYYGSAVGEQSLLVMKNARNASSTGAS
jgi:hypothetical protein